VTKVIKIISTRASVRLCLALALIAAPTAVAQPRPAAFAPSATETTALPERPAEALYLRLRSVGLDKSRVYHIREVTLERAAFHITFDDGTIAFTEDVDGHVTGAFFEGEGEVLLVPGNQAERASMMLFTGAAILEEKFATAYFRFNDDTFAELQPSLRPADNAQEFISQWDPAARNLAQLDSLRLLISFSNSLPAAAHEGSSTPAPMRADDDRMLHARLQGRNLGTFDLYFDSLAAEQIWAGQLKTVEGQSYYDVWSAFTLGHPGGRSGDAAGVMGEEAKPEAVSVSQYKIRARVAPPTKLEAEAWLHLEVREGGQRAVLFELSRFLQVAKVEADARPLESIHNQALEGTQLARRGNDLVAVVFPQPLRAGQQIDLHFVYGGDVLSEAGAGLLYVGERGTWYPNRGLEMSRFDLQFSYPADWTLVATGKKVDGASPEVRPGEQSSHWISDRPMPVAGFNLGKYSHVTAKAGDIQVEAYATASVERTFPQGTTAAVAPEPVEPYRVGSPNEITIATVPPSPARHAQAVANSSASAADFFAHRFGPYPYTGLSLTQMPGNVSQGWPSLIFLSSFSFLAPEDKSQLHMSPVVKIMSDLIIGHETAHQWWGDLVSWKSYRDQWVFEALANYSALLMLESESPQHFRLVMEKYRQDLLGKNRDGAPLADAGPVTFGTRLNCSHFPAGYEAISYGRGTWLFHMLRSMLRDAERESRGRAASLSDAQADALFMHALGKVRERFQERAINTREFLQVFEEELPPSLRYEGRKSLDWFYEGWINGTALPRLELQSVKYLPKPDGVNVIGTILQKDAPKELVTAVPVYAVLAGKNVLLGQVFADGPETSFRLPAPAGTRKVVLDPYQTILTRP
jgi:hypothetical protein